MHSLAAHELVEVWERGEGKHPIDKALLCLAAAWPEQPWEALAESSVGRRNDLLLALHQLTFGPRLEGFAECPQCGERLEFALDIADLRAVGTEEGTPTPLLADGVEIVFRLPDSRDLAAMVACDDVPTARDRLVHRCVVQARRGKDEIAPETLPAEATAVLAERLAACDPLADIRLELGCPACEHRWPLALDPVTFLWVRIAERATHLLREVHTLAWAYGWREADILAMSARRRQCYMDMVAG